MPTTRSQAKKAEQKEERNIKEYKKNKTPKEKKQEIKEDEIERSIKEVNLKRVGFEAIAETYKSKSYMPMDEVKEIIKERIEQFRQEKLSGLEFFVSMLDDAGKPVSSAEFNMNEDFSLGDLVDYEGNEIVTETKNFTLFIWKPTKAQQVDYYKMFNVAPPKEGGCDGEYNDCLFRCIERALGGDSEMPAGINTPPKFKKFLGLGKCAKVPLKSIPDVEDKIKHKINVSGDYSYTSDKKYIPSINLRLTDGHYEYDTKKIKKEDLLRTLSHGKDKPIIIENTSNENVKTYDGENYKTMTFKEIEDLKLHKMKGFYYYNQDEPTLKESYKKLKQDTKELKEHGIDLDKAYGNNKNASIRLLYNDIAHMEGPEAITEFEEKWLLGGSRGPLVYGEKLDNQITAFQYDANSYYSSNLLKIGIPMKQPEWITIEDDVPKIFNYGMYRCRIQGTGSKIIDRNFKFNEQHLYTHYDLECAKLLGFTIEMIHDDEANFMSYTGKHIAGKFIFGKTINKLHKMKRDKVPRAKELMTNLWGGLCKKLKTTVHEHSTGEIPENAKILAMDRILDENGDVVDVVADYVIKGQTFQYRFGRLEPFLLSYSRYNLVRTIKDKLNQVKRVHTDSILSTVSFDDLKIGQLLGEWKLEHANHKVKLNGIKRPEWF